MSRRIRCSRRTAPTYGSICPLRFTKRRSAAKCACRRSTAPGRTFRLKGKGLKSKSGAGDLLASVRIMLPERSDEEFKELMRQWREAKPYDPRKDLE
jgi:DnaJ-class molecular chaperone